ncbi:MAG TPA: type III-A CRISPR-associated RAMP protein Csm5, partial [Thermodesulfovibrionia bacterium]|nr:type III-A CRISPR-associated RAMP protein Csm5 [Thermodesulfovibrionia bacterium]
MSNQLQSYQVRLHLLSPVHIGTQEELDPFSYVIHNNTLYLIDLTKWIEHYHNPKEIHKMMDSNNFASVRTFIARHFDNPEAVLCAVATDSLKLIDDYDKAIKESNPINQVIVNPMTRNSVSQEAYVPGSSIKGAIRTAIANKF